MWPFQKLGPGFRAAAHSFLRLAVMVAVITGAALAIAGLILGRLADGFAVYDKIGIVGIGAIFFLALGAAVIIKQSKAPLAERSVRQTQFGWTISSLATVALVATIVTAYYGPSDKPADAPRVITAQYVRGDYPSESIDNATGAQTLSWYVAVDDPDSRDIMYVFRPSDVNGFVGIDGKVEVSLGPNDNCADAVVRAAIQSDDPDSPSAESLLILPQQQRNGLGVPLSEKTRELTFTANISGSAMCRQIPLVFSMRFLPDQAK